MILAPSFQRFLRRIARALSFEASTRPRGRGGTGARRRGMDERVFEAELHPGLRLIRVTEAGNAIYCCAHCAQNSDVKRLKDRAA